MSKHTPGPWKFEHRRTLHGPWSTEVFCGAGETIATLTWYPMPTTSDGVTGSYREGNARLIAAAPELLDACRKALYALKGREHDQFLRDAIAKATGGES